MNNTKYIWYCQAVYVKDKTSILDPFLVSSIFLQAKKVNAMSKFSKKRPMTTYDELMRDPSFKKIYKKAYHELVLSELMLAIIQKDAISIRSLSRSAFKALICIFCLFTNFLFATPERHEIDTDANNPLVYYLDSSKEHNAPIVILIEGSYNDAIGPESILRLHKKIATPFLQAGMHIVLLERRGVDGKQIDIDLFHQFNFPSQRLSDHLTLIQYLRNNPPPHWNGQFIVIGGSEGGPIAIKLAHQIHPLACVAIVGCGSTSFKEYIWKTIQSIQAESPWGTQSLISWYYDIPVTRDAYEQQYQLMKANPTPKEKWFGQTFLYWADALDQTEDQEFLALKCPAIVVAGEKDIECSSTDHLIEVSRQHNQDVTYLRIEGMKHDALDPKWHVIDLVINALHEKHLLAK